MKRLLLPARYNYIEAYLTLRCNLGCSYCINNGSGGNADRQRNELSPGQWAAGLNRIDYGDVPLTLGGGEPTLYQGFYELLNRLRPDISIDLLTNLSFDVEEFIDRVAPERLNSCKLPAYKSIRVSYHVEKMDPAILLAKVIRLQESGFNVGIFGLNHPHHIEANMKMAEMACENKVFFFVKDFLGDYSGRLFGHFKYPAALDRTPKPAHCRTREILIGPGGGVYRCHRDLYRGEGAISHVNDPDFRVEDIFRPCENFGNCNPCDVKLKTNRYLQMGSCSVEIMAM